jgi:hypothetical protein
LFDVKKISDLKLNIIMILIELIYPMIFYNMLLLGQNHSRFVQSKKSQNRSGKNNNKGMVASKSQIREKLDQLSDQYKQGVITKEQYYKRANVLIDKISDKYSDVIWTY